MQLYHAFSLIYNSLYQGVVVLLQFRTRALYMRVLDTPGLVSDASDRKRPAALRAVGTTSRGAQRGQLLVKNTFLASKHTFLIQTRFPLPILGTTSLKVNQVLKATLLPQVRRKGAGVDTREWHAVLRAVLEVARPTPNAQPPTPNPQPPTPTPQPSTQPQT